MRPHLPKVLEGHSDAVGTCYGGAHALAKKLKDAGFLFPKCPALMAVDSEATWAGSGMTDEEERASRVHVLQRVAGHAGL